MIRSRGLLCVIADDLFHTASDVIAKSAVATSIEQYHRDAAGAGGRRLSGIDYTVTAVLVSLLIRFLMHRSYSQRGAMDTIGELSPEQLAAVGMRGQDCSPIRNNAAQEYKRFARFWSARMEPLDPFFDLPARRMTNAEFDERLRARSDDDRMRSELADQRLTTLLNDLLYGSVRDASRADCEGDCVVDETIINTAKSDGTLGVRADRFRGASPAARFWARDKKGQIHESRGGDDFRASGFGVGATFVSRVARRDALHAEPPLFVGMDVHAPTSGSVKHLATALSHAERTGINPRRGGRNRRPLLTADMGYNPKNGFAELMQEIGYSPVVRFPKHWNVQHPSANPPGHTNSVAPGPLQHCGAFFCPAVINRIAGHRTPSTKEMLGQDGFRSHDRRLQRIYPFLMGSHTRPTMADCQFGRPRLGVAVPRRVKVRLVCPAALGSVMCPLKPESMHTDIQGLPLAEPTWNADDLACCRASSVTVYLTDGQLKMAQWELVPGSWEHTLYFEAARSLTEQRFSMLKSKHVGGLLTLTSGPRRTPMLKLAIALAAVTVNIRAQENHNPNEKRRESIDVRWRQLANDLGQRPTPIPPRS